MSKKGKQKNNIISIIIKSIISLVIMFFAVCLLTESEYFFGGTILFIGFLCSPLFNYIYKKFNRKFSYLQKLTIIVVLITLMVLNFFLSLFNSIRSFKFIEYYGLVPIFVAIIFIVLMLVFNKHKYTDEINNSFKINAISTIIAVLFLYFFCKVGAIIYVNYFVKYYGLFPDTSERTINHKELEDSEYYHYKGMKFKNVVDDWYLRNGFTSSWGKDNNRISFIEYNDYIIALKNSDVSDYIDKYGFYLNKHYLDKHNINNFYDLIRFIYEKKNVNIFDSFLEIVFFWEYSISNLSTSHIEFIKSDNYYGYIGQIRQKSIYRVYLYSNDSTMHSSFLLATEDESLLNEILETVEFEDDNNALLGDSTRLNLINLYSNDSYITDDFSVKCDSNDSDRCLYATMRIDEINIGIDLNNVSDLYELKMPNNYVMTSKQDNDNYINIYDSKGNLVNTIENVALSYCLEDKSETDSIPTYYNNRLYYVEKGFDEENNAIFSFNYLNTNDMSINRLFSEKAVNCGTE